MFPQISIHLAAIVVVLSGCAAHGEAAEIGPDTATAALDGTGETLGATPHEGGVTFGLWAPNADAVSVAGDFNEWVAGATPMTRDEHGNWWADVAGAHAGQEYLFVIRHGASELWK